MMDGEPKPDTLREWLSTTTPPGAVIVATVIGYGVIAFALGQKLWAALLG